MQRSPRATSPKLVLVACIAALFAFEGCTQLADFDRSKIPDQNSKDGGRLPDGGNGMDGGKDAGGMDASPDANMTEGGTGCSPANHDGCGEDQLCCDTDSNGSFECVTTSPTQCESCGTPCDADVADVCTKRSCGCGAGSTAECEGSKPFCAESACVECDVADNDGCSGTQPICKAGACEACAMSPDNCGGTLKCLSSGACQCSASADCTTPTTPICGDGFTCRGCATGRECEDSAADTSVCEVGTGTCVECLLDTDCDTATEYCSSKTCTLKKGAGTSCAGNSECTSAHCVDDVCCGTSCAGTCNACSTARKGAGASGTCGPIVAGDDPDNECSDALTCNGAGACEKVNGASCGGAAECDSGFCVDGVCCGTACGGTCNACSAAKTDGANGTCGDVKVDTDPENECTGALTCNASGACEKATGASCGAAAECDSGFCVDNVCCESACGGICRACSNAKTGAANGTCDQLTAGTDEPEDGCAGALTCNASGACEKAQGASCSGASECDSGFCVDTVCCDTACAGTCSACSAIKTAGADGTCGFIPMTDDPDGECAPSTCDGSGACTP